MKSQIISAHNQGYHTGTGTSTLPEKTKISGRKGQMRASTFARNFLSLPEIAPKKEKIE